jgi:hypothetical protein
VNGMRRDFYCVAPLVRFYFSLVNAIPLSGYYYSIQTKLILFSVIKPHILIPVKAAVIVLRPKIPRQPTKQELLFALSTSY